MRVFIVLCAIALCIVVVRGDGDDEKAKKMEKWKKAMQCDGKDLKMDALKGMKAGKTACFKKYAGDVGDDKAKIHEALKKLHGNTCFNICNVQVKGVLDGTGAFNETATTEMAHKFYPTPELADQMAKGLKQCSDDCGLDKPLSMDNDCIAYKPFEDCMKKKHMEVCKIEMPDMNQDA